MKIKVLLYFLLLSSCFSIYGSINLKTLTEGTLILPEEIQVFEDTSGTLSFLELKDQANFEAYSEFRFIDNVSSTYWIKLDLVGDSTRKWVFEILTPQTEYVAFFHPSGGGYKQRITGHLFPYFTRLYQHKNFVFDLDIPNSGGSVYLQIKSKNKVGFFFKVHSQESFTNYALQEYWLLGCYYGILLLLIVYHLILYFSLKKLVYLFYSITVFFAGLISMSDDGFGVIYIWNEHKNWSQFIGLYILPLAYLFAFASYSITFIGSRFRPIQKWILWACGAYFVLFFLQLLFSQQQVYFSVFYSLPFIAIYVFFLYSFIRFRFKPALIFLVGFSFSLFGLVVNQLRLLQFIEGNIFTVYAFNIGVVLEFLSMAFSLSYRYKEQERHRRQLKEKEIKILEEKNEAQKNMVIAVQEKEKATREINETLEVKVIERTQQLSDLIAKLKGLNYEYDRENWELKRVVKKEKTAHFTQEKMSLSEIREIFPTNQRCYEFLSELKWKDVVNYTCARCDHDKYSVNDEKYSRKCSRCATTTSVTKDSIFQSLKLPLTKLFYITYLWNKDDKLNIKALADDLEISEASLYKFLTRLKEQKKEKIKKKQEVNSWVDLIF